MGLNTIEKFLLLAHYPKKGGFISPLNYVKLGFSGCVFLELALLNKISIKKRRIFIKNNTDPVDHFFLYKILNEIGQGDKPKVLKSRIMSLYRKRISNMWLFLEEMADKNILRIEKKRFLWMIPYRKSYLINTAERELLISELKTKLVDQQGLNSQDLAIIGLIDICKLYPCLSNIRIERIDFERCVKNVLKNYKIQDSVDDSIKQIIKITRATMYLTVYYVGTSTSR